MSNVRFAEYVNYELTLSQDQFLTFCKFFSAQGIQTKVLSAANGGIYLFLIVKNEEKLFLHLTKSQETYHVKQRFTITDQELVEALQDSIAPFGITANAFHHQGGSEVQFIYRRGVVDQIVEYTGGTIRLLYDAGGLHRSAGKGVMPSEGTVQSDIDLLLDRRNKTKNLFELMGIDERLRLLVAELKTERETQSLP